ncbi:hypothetical protein ACFX2B_027192 [Malus domestica]
MSSNKDHDGGFVSFANRNVVASSILALRRGMFLLDRNHGLKGALNGPNPNIGPELEETRCKTGPMILQLYCKDNFFSFRV